MFQDGVLSYNICCESWSRITPWNSLSKNWNSGGGWARIAGAREFHRFQLFVVFLCLFCICLLVRQAYCEAVKQLHIFWACGVCVCRWLNQIWRSFLTVGKTTGLEYWCLIHADSRAWDTWLRLSAFVSMLLLDTSILRGYWERFQSCYITLHYIRSYLKWPK